MPEIGVPELLIVAVIVLLLFGPGKAADLGGSLGKSIREFRRASTEDTDTQTPLASASATPPVEAASGSSVSAGASPAAAVANEKFCTNCGAGVTPDQRFCTDCGTSRT